MRASDPAPVPLTRYALMLPEGVHAIDATNLTSGVLLSEADCYQWVKAVDVDALDAVLRTALADRDEARERASSLTCSICGGSAHLHCICGWVSAEMGFRLPTKADVLQWRGKHPDLVSQLESRAKQTDASELRCRDVETKLRTALAERDSARACLDSLAADIRAAFGERYRAIVDEAGGDISVNTAFKVALRDEREAWTDHRDALAQAVQAYDGEGFEPLEEERDVVGAARALVQVRPEEP